MSRKLHIQDTFNTILARDLKNCFDKDVIKIFQPKDQALGDIFIHLAKITPEQFDKLDLLSWISSYIYDEKGFLNIRIKDDVLIDILQKETHCLTKNNLMSNIDNFDIQYCYARCCSILKEAISIGWQQPNKITNLQSLTSEMRLLLICLILDHMQQQENPSDILNFLKKIALLFNEAWNHGVGTRLRFIDERDMTKTNLNLSILVIVKSIIDNHLARIGMKVLDELYI